MNNADKIVYRGSASLHKHISPKRAPEMSITGGEANISSQKLKRFLIVL